MSYRTPLPCVAALMALLGACSEEQSSVAPVVPEPLVDLALEVPVVTDEDLIFVGGGDGVDRGDSSHREGVPQLGDSAWDFDDEEPVEPTKIFSPKTVSGFFSGGAYAEGSHRFTGHAAKVETTAHVTWNDAHLASATSIEQRSWWLSLKTIKFIYTVATVRSDYTCGLSVQGESSHWAWWELFSGRAAPIWGTSRTSTRSGWVSQSRCGRVASNRDPTGETRETPGIVCTYLITYDRDTLEILHVQRLSCGTPGDILL